MWKPEEHGNVDLATYDEVPVCYKVVTQNVNKWYRNHLPILAVHIGVWKSAGSLFLESRSFNDKYTNPDVTCAIPTGGLCCSGSAPQVMKSVFDVASLVDALNRNSVFDKKAAQLVGVNLGPEASVKYDAVGQPVEVSGQNVASDDNQVQLRKGDEYVRFAVNNDPGRFLCGYMYYSSLHVDAARRRVLFVHVPDADSPWSVEAMAEAVYRLLDLLLQSPCSNCSATIALCQCSHCQPALEGQSAQTCDA